MSGCAPEIRGWCPGALRPMMSGDGLVVRVRPLGGWLSTGALARIADLAAHHGNGLIDFSARGNVQLRGIGARAHSAVIAGLAELGLIDPNAEAEARRNVLVTPFWAAGDGTQDLALELAAALVSEQAPRTPGKFGYAVDTGPLPVLRDAAADIRIERGATGALMVRADGADRAVRVTRDRAVRVALDLARWFLASGGAPDGRGRMTAHLARAPLPDRFTTDAVASAPPFHPVPGPCDQGMLAGIEFGQADAKTVSLLAESGAIRVTPWRMVLIEGTLADPAPFLTRPGDTRLSVIACTGAPACPQAHLATRPLARRLAPVLPAGRTLHVSGCAKGCALQGRADITLVGRAGGRFDLIRNGTVSDPPALTGLMPDAITPDTLKDESHAPLL